MAARAHRARAEASSPMRGFDPRRVGALECRAWETYYRHEWAAFLAASVGMVRGAFRMSWPRTLRGAWLVLRANQKWAPVPDNDPDSARALMAGFYRLLAAAEPSATFDPARAAELEIEWWRVHRAHQGGAEGLEALVASLTDLYAYCYDADAATVRRAAELRAAATVRRAAELRAEAMDVSDAWVVAGCDPDDPRLRHERALLIRSYAALLAAVHR